MQQEKESHRPIVHLRNRHHQHQILQALLRLLCGAGSEHCALVLHQCLQLQWQVLLEKRMPAAQYATVCALSISRIS